MSSPYVSRINQIDAAELDGEIYKVLKSQVAEITKYQPLGKIDQWQPEIDAILKILIWNYSLRTGQSTFGQQLLNLRYSNISKAKSVLYIVLSVLPDYARRKAAGYAMPSDNQAAIRLKYLLEQAVNAFKAYELLNLLMFLHRGSQARVIERLLGISSSSITSHRPRNIGYSYMTRELLWHGLIELFTLGLPMINFYYLKETFRRIFSRRKRKADVARTFPTMDRQTKCAYCDDSPILPSHAGCQHIFCYYCLKAHFTAVDEFQCPRCSFPLRVKDMKSYQVAQLS